jgi:hypothetical protein
MCSLIIDAGRIPPGGVRKGKQQKLPSTRSHWYWITLHLRVRFTVRFGTNCGLVWATAAKPI